MNNIYLPVYQNVDLKVIVQVLTSFFVQNAKTWTTCIRLNQPINDIYPFGYGEPFNITFGSSFNCVTHFV